MLELLFYFLVLGPFLMNEKEKGVFTVVVVSVVTLLTIVTLFNG